MPSNQGVKAALSLIEKDPSKILGLSVHGREIKSPGEYIGRADAQEAPQMTLANPQSPDAQYVVIALDIDAPFPSFTLLGPILHWIQGGFRPSTAEPGAARTSLVSSDPFIANYIGPAPPPGSGPHRYCFFLYQQPDSFDASKWAPADGAKLGNMSRMWASLDDWSRSLQLGELLAFNYFTSN